MPSLAEALKAVPDSGPAVAAPEDDEALSEALSDAKAAWESDDARALGRALNLLRELTDD